MRWRAKPRRVNRCWSSASLCFFSLFSLFSPFPLPLFVCPGPSWLCLPCFVNSQLIFNSQPSLADDLRLDYFLYRLPRFCCLVRQHYFEPPISSTSAIQRPHLIVSITVAWLLGRVRNTIAHSYRRMVHSPEWGINRSPAAFPTFQ